MANAKEIQTRMKSIQDTMKITNAMYMISSSKMQKAKTDPVRVIRELQLLAEGSIDTAEDVIERLRGLEKDLPDPLYPPLCNTGGKVPKKPQKTPPSSRKSKP